MPPRVKTDDGWVATQHANADREAKRGHEQERERNARRRVPVEAAQPQPAGRTPPEETLDSLLGNQ